MYCQLGSWPFCSSEFSLPGAEVPRTFALCNLQFLELSCSGTLRQKDICEDAGQFFLEKDETLKY